jgi:putative ATPase
LSLFDGVPESPVGTGKGALHASPNAPLAERMRPRTLDQYVGQEHLLGPGKPLRVQIDRDAQDAQSLGSMIFWGPPGVGKTTLAKIIAETTKANFVEFSAVLSGIKEIKQVMAAAAQAAEMQSRTILFVDEIHRFNKAQQDAFLPYVERGTIRLIGATTENPSFEIISALLSRCRVYVLQPLSEERIAGLLRKALEDKERGLGSMELTADDEALELMASYSSGDCRSAYNTLDVAAQLATEGAKHIDKEVAKEAVQQRVLMYDKSGEEHYNLISALHKSVRNSDPDAALYWLARMFAAGEDPLYLARRVVRMAVEDIGLAAPEALNLCLSAKEAIDFLGSPEGDLALAEAVVYLCLAPKSNAVYTAYGAVQQEVEETRQEPVPLHLRNAPTRLMKDLGYAKGYRYAHDEEDRVANMDCLPDSLRGRSYYHPTQEGREKQLAQRMEEIRRIRAGKRGERNLDQ